MQHRLPLLFAILLPPLPLAAGEGEATPEKVALPPPAALEMPLGEALRKRRSCRSFDPARRPSREEIAALLWAAAGITLPDPEHSHGGKRAAPSAFEAYAVDVVVTSAEGTFVYSPREHALVPHAVAGKKDLRREVPRSDWVREAPVLILLVADVARYPEGVRPERRRDYAHADAAVIGQNLYLAATALGLATVLTADARPEAGELLGLGEGQRIVFILPAGSAAAEGGEKR
jgi:SagB-type dehydrogenase family enzyme